MQFYFSEFKLLNLLLIKWEETVRGKDYLDFRIAQYIYFILIYNSYEKGRKKMRK